MKLGILFFFTAIMMSCSTSKTKETTEVETPIVAEITDEVILIGIVRLNNGGCELSIEVEGSDVQLHPVGLNEMFKVEGAALQFKYTPSRAMLPEGCENTKAVVLSEVVRLKR